MNSTVQNIKPGEHKSAVDMTLHELDTEFYRALFPLKPHTRQVFRIDAQFSVTKQTSENGAPLAVIWFLLNILLKLKMKLWQFLTVMVL